MMVVFILIVLGGITFLLFNLVDDDSHEDY